MREREDIVDSDPRWPPAAEEGSGQMREEKEEEAGHDVEEESRKESL